MQNIYSEDVTFSFDEANHTVAEGDDIYIQIMLSHALSSEIEIPLEVRRVAGTADPISRISGVPQSVIFEPGATSLEFSVSVSDDRVASGTDSVVVVEPIGWTRRISAGIPDRVTLSISDDDEAAVEISPQSLFLAEGGTDAYTVVLGSEPTGAVTIVPAVVGNSDASLNVANLNFDAANWNVPQRVTVSAAEDSDADDDSATITHTVSGADYAGVAGPTVVVSVSDNETASTAVRIGVDTSTVDEEGGPRDVTVTATLNGAPLSNDVVLTVSVEDDSAEESTDFEAVTEFDVTIEGGSSAGSQVFTLTPISDQRDEGDETLLVSATTSASLAVGPSPGLVLKIIDDDTAGVTITPVELSFAEGASDTYSVVLDSEPSDTVQIEISRSGSSDVTVSPAQLTFTTSDWATARTMTVNSAQDDDMADDSATIKHTVQGGDYEGRTARGVQVAVVDDDAAGLVLDKTSVSVDEDGSGTFTVALATQPTATVTVAVASGDVAAATVSPAGLTFTASDWDTAQAVTVAGVDDADSADETVTVTLDADSGDTAYGALDDVTVDVAVADDDAAGLVLDKTSVSVDEDGSGTFTVALATQPTATVTVAVASGDVAAATVSPAGLTFTASDWDTAQAVTVAGVDDADSADETVTVTLDADSGDTAYGALDDVTVDVAVADDDDDVGLPILSGITVWGEERLESEVWAIFLVKLHTAMSAEMTLEYATADGTARAGEDYVATSGTLTIRAGATSASVLVNLVEDSIAEDDETVVLRVKVPSDETQQAISGTALIIDDDNVGVLDIGDAKRREGDAHIPFEVTLSRPSANDVAVDYETADGTATAGQDYVARAGTLTIPAGELAASIKVALLDDSIDEIHERFTVELRNAENAYMGDSSGTGTIVDGDPLPVMVVGVVEAAESEPEVELTITLTSISSRLITADYITFDHTAVGDGVDYATTAGSLRFEPGETHKTIRIPIVDDDLNEGDETFTVILKNIKNARRGDRSHSVTILDDDGHSVSNAGSRTTNNEERFPAVANRTVWIGVRASRPRRAGLHPAGES